MSEVSKLFVREHGKRWPLFTVMVLLSLLVTALAFVTPYVYKTIIDVVIPHRDVRQLVLLIAIMVLTQLVYPVVNVLHSVIVSKGSMASVNAIRRHLFVCSGELSLGTVQRSGVGQVAARLKDDTNQYAGFLVGALNQLVAMTFNLVLAIGLMAMVNVRLMMVTVPVVLMLGVISIWLRRPVTDAERAVRETDSGLLRFLTDAMGGLRSIRALGAQEEAAGMLDVEHRAYATARNNSACWSGFSNSLSGLVLSLPYPAVLGYGSYLVLRGEMSIGGIVMFLIVIGRLFGPLVAMSSLWFAYASALAPLRRLEELFEEPLRASVRPPCSTPMPGGDLRLEGVRFSWEDGGVAILADWLLRSGATHGLQGPSGSGKSTLLNVMAGLERPQGGRMALGASSFDEVDPRRWRRTVTVVGAPHFLLPISIKENLKLAQPDASDEMLHRVLSIVEADEFVARYPEGIEHILDQGVGSISTGEAARLAIARALLMSPRVLLLDEVTASLSQDLERRVLERIRAAFGRMTIVIATHRLQTMELVDDVMVLENGGLRPGSTEPSRMASAVAV